MSLAKALELMFGVTLSTGAVLVLSGGAFAADGGEGTTPQLNAGTLAQQGSSDAAVSKNANLINVFVVGGKAGTNSAVGANAAVVGSADQAVSAGAATDVATPSAPVGASELMAPTIVGGEKGDIGSLSAVPLDTSANQGAAVLMAGGIGTVEKTDASTAMPLPKEAVVGRAFSLEIGPKITTTNLQLNDLASMIPSAPAQRQNPSVPPEPVIPSGLLSNFAAMLAGTVVPSVFAVTNLVIPAMESLISILATILLLVIGRALSTFGSLTRRGGFAHAARSDVPAAIFYSFFATPLRLGYVLAFSPQHNPFLMVSENKTVLSMVPNAIERRK